MSVQFVADKRPFGSPGSLGSPGSPLLCCFPQISLRALLVLWVLVFLSSAVEGSAAARWPGPQGSAGSVSLCWPGSGPDGEKTRLNWQFFH